MSYTLTTLELASISISGNNPRKTFDQDALQELATSIKQIGVLQPILVRTVNDKYELVCGERRYRASELAGMATIPAQVRENMTDDDAFDAMIMENLDRRDVHPLEEAEAFQLMINSGRYTVADVAAKIAKDEKFVRARLSLNDLLDEVKQDFYHGELNIGHAVLIARLTPEGQQEILDDYKNAGVDGYGTVRELTDEIKKERFDLDDALFDRDRDYKCALACTNCDKRTSNQPVLFHDMQDVDSCLSKSCFRAKNNEFVELKALEIIHSGSKTLFGKGWQDNPADGILTILKENGYPVLKQYDDFSTYESASAEKHEMLYVAGTNKGLIKTVWIPKKTASKSAGSGAPIVSGNTAEILRLKQVASRALELDAEKIHAGVKEAVEKKLTGKKIPEFSFDANFSEAMFLFIALDTYPLWSMSELEKFGYPLKKEYKQLDNLVEDILLLTPDQKTHLLALLINRKFRHSLNGSTLYGQIMRQLAIAGNIPIAEIEAPIKAKAKDRIARSEERIKALEEPKTTKTKA